MELRLDGKAAVVTGASRGIGLAIATAFVEAGARVMLVARNPEPLRAAAAGIGAGAAVFPADAGEPDQADACVAETVERLGRLDILVNNAAVCPHVGPIIDADLARYDATNRVNLRGPLAWAQAAWRHAMQAAGGVILNVSSIGGMVYGGPLGVYDNTKAALNHLTGHLAADLAPGVRVNGIAPGLVKTEFARPLWAPDEAGAARRIPLGRLGRPDDVAATAVFLASDAASWITGQTFVVDGGAVLRDLFRQG